MEDIIFVSKSTQECRTWLKTIVVCFMPFMTFCILIFVCNVMNVTIMCSSVIWGLLIVGGILYPPNKYIISNTHVIIQRYIGDIKIPLEDIQDIRRFTKKDKNSCLSGIRADGVFGNCGLYRSNIHGKLYVYTRRDSNWTLIVTSRKKYVIAPNDIHLIDVIQDKIIKVKNNHNK